MTSPLRVTVSLSADEVAVVERMKHAGTAEAATLHDLTGITVPTGASAAQSVHALLVAGLTAIEKEAERIGYARQAEFERDHPDCVAWRAVQGARRLPAFMSPEGSNAVAGAA